MGYNRDALLALFENVTPDDEERDKSELAELIDEHGYDVVRATIEYAPDGDPSVEIHDLRRNLENHYRGAYRTFGEFVRQEKVAYLSGKAEEIFNELVEYVDWEEYSERPEWSGYRTIKLDSDDESGPVYVFS